MQSSDVFWLLSVHLKISTRMTTPRHTWHFCILSYFNAQIIKLKYVSEYRKKMQVVANFFEQGSISYFYNCLWTCSSLFRAQWFGSVVKCFIRNTYGGNERETYMVKCCVHITCTIQKDSLDTLAIWDRLLVSTDLSLRSAFLTALEISGDWRYIFSMATD